MLGLISCNACLQPFFLFLLIIIIIVGLAWDWVTEQLYWSDPCTDMIGVYDPITAKHKFLIATGSGSDPRDIVVDPTTR